MPANGKQFLHVVNKDVEINGSSIQVEHFGNCRITKIGILVGAQSKGSCDDLTHHIKAIIWDQSGFGIPILLSRENIFKG